MPSEIQKVFKLASLKDAYQIPENDQVQAINITKLKTALSNAKLTPKHDFTVSRLELIHEYDQKVKNEVFFGKLNLVFEHGVRQRKRLTDVIKGGDVEVYG